MMSVGLLLVGVGLIGNSVIEITQAVINFIN